MSALDIGSGYVPDFIRNEVLPSLPRRSGEGIHRALYDLARVLAPWRTAAQCAAILRSYAALCDRCVPESEIVGALRDGARRAWQPGQHPAASRLPALRGGYNLRFDLEAFRASIAGEPRITAERLIEQSPIPVGEVSPAGFLAALFLKGEKVLIFDDIRTQGQLWLHSGPYCDARSLERFVRGRRHGVWFLGPVDGRFRVNDARKLSRRSAQNLTSRRFLVAESDRHDIAPEEWLTALVRLGLPIVSVCETGDRLAHALILAGAAGREEWDHTRDELRPALVKIGADVASLSAVRLTRLPCCERLGRLDASGVYQKFQDGPRMQRLLFLNPGGVPITAL